MFLKKPNATQQTAPVDAAIVAINDRINQWASHHDGLAATVAQRRAEEGRLHGRIDQLASSLNDKASRSSETLGELRGAVKDALARAITAEAKADSASSLAAHYGELIDKLAHRVSATEDAMHEHPTEADSAADEEAEGMRHRILALEAALAPANTEDEEASEASDDVVEVDLAPAYDALRVLRGKIDRAHRRQLGGDETAGKRSLAGWKRDIAEILALLGYDEAL